MTGRYIFVIVILFSVISIPGTNVSAENVCEKPVDCYQLAIEQLQQARSLIDSERESTLASISDLQESFQSLRNDLRALMQDQEIWADNIETRVKLLETEVDNLQEAKSQYFVAKSTQIGKLEDFVIANQYDRVTDAVNRFCGDRDFLAGVWSGGGSEATGYGLACIHK